MCVYIFMCVYIYVFIFLYVYIYIYVYVHIHIHVYIYSTLPYWTASEGFRLHPTQVHSPFFFFVTLELRVE